MRIPDEVCEQVKVVAIDPGTGNEWEFPSNKLAWFPEKGECMILPKDGGDWEYVVDKVVHRFTNGMHEARIILK